LKVELFIEDPMGEGCGCSTSMKDRMALVKKLREEAQIWYEIKQCCDAEFTRTVLSAKVPAEKYPSYLRDAQAQNEPPFLFIDGKLVHCGSFPSVSLFVDLI